jgi:hypothetical protein
MNSNMKYLTKIVDIPFYQVEDENMYAISHLATVTAASTYELDIVTGSVKTPLFMEVVANSTCMVTVYEGVTFTGALANSVTIQNMYRGSGNSCAAVAFRNNAWSTNSEVAFYSDMIIGDKYISDMNKLRWILQSSTNYAIRITNQAGSTICATYNINFFEE